MKGKLLTLLLLSQFCLAIAQTSGLIVKQEAANKLVPVKMSCNPSIISNITFVGDNRMIGSFDGSRCNIGLKDGIILSTGHIQDAVGPNNLASKSSKDSLVGDLDLEKVLATSNVTHDAAVLEFDFVAVSDTLNIRYVFASEEYLEFVHTNYNDLFGCFLSGPGISGPYSKQSVNIATVPGTQSYVGVNTINKSNNTFRKY